jgi:hypothetical protein
MAVILVSGATLVATNFRYIKVVDASRDALSAERPTCQPAFDCHRAIDQAFGSGWSEQLVVGAVSVNSQSLTASRKYK